jgi:acyl carrier protein
MGEIKMNEILNILKDVRPEINFETENNFISNGFLDSFDMITLVTELEKKFDILIDPLDILPENFESIDTIAKVVKKNGGVI